MSYSVESEIERRIELLRTFPSFRENGWSLGIACQWLSTGVKIVSITIFRGRYHEVVFTVSRDSQDISTAINDAFNYATEKLEKLHEERDTGLGEMPRNKGALS